MFRLVVLGKGKQRVGTRMIRRKVAIAALALLPGSLVYAETTCTQPQLTDEQVVNIIATARASRTDLPPAFEHYRTVIRRDGCYYVYIEVSLPETPDLVHIFRLNQNGQLVDAQAGNE